LDDAVAIDGETVRRQEFAEFGAGRHVAKPADQLCLHDRQC
jgi:hypothetical protein